MDDYIHVRCGVIEGLIAIGKYERALSVIHDTVETIITVPVTTEQPYTSPRLDALTQEIGTKLWKESGPVALPATGQTYMYLATKLQRSGGHTRLLRDFILARPEARHVVLTTGLAGRSDKAWLTKTFASIKHYTHLHAPRGGYAATVRWLQAQLAAHAPTHTYLFNHHQDVTIIAAMVPELQSPASFCHHGDHHLTLGMNLQHVTHLDFHPTGFHICRERLGIANSYIPFTLPRTVQRGDAPFMENGTLTTCTAAGRNKVESPYPLRYVDVVPMLLKATGGTHVHIGRLSRRALSQLQCGLKQHHIPPHRLVYIPWVQNLQKTMLEYHVDLYVSSFPLGGGLTAVEVMGAGIPLVVHKHLVTRELGGLDIAYPGAFAWRTLSELTEYLLHLTPTELQKQSIEAYAHYERYYSQPLRTLLDEPLPVAPSLSAEFTPEREDWQRWVKQQSGPQKAFYRCAYRLYRKLRRLLVTQVTG